MTIRAYYIEDAAHAQLEVALRLYFGGEDKDDFLSVITLAGAADEIFGKLLTDKGVDSSIENIKKAVMSMHALLALGGTITPGQVADRANGARNRLKHWNARTDGPMLKLDPIEEARDMLNRAIDNYWMLKQMLTPAMERFQAENFARGEP